MLKIAKLLIELMGIFSQFPLVMPILDGGNSVGAELLNIHPRLPAEKTDGSSYPAGGLGCHDLMKGAIDGRIKILLIFSHRFGMDFTSSELRHGMENIDYVIRADYFHSGLNESANLLLPMASPYEKSGHYVNNEGRFDFMARGAHPKDGITPTLEIISKIALGLGSEGDFRADALIREILSDARFGEKLTLGGFVYAKEERSSIARMKEIKTLSIPFTGEKYPFILLSYQPFWRGDETILKSVDTGKRLPVFNVMINPDDSNARGLMADREVQIESEYGVAKAVLHLNKKMPKNYLLIPEGYLDKNLPDIFGGKDRIAVRINPLRPDS
jgi:predicted molibdopterin-dependent oxidoreductase YjgC